MVITVFFSLFKRTITVLVSSSAKRENNDTYMQTIPRSIACQTDRRTYTRNNDKDRTLRGVPGSLPSSLLHEDTRGTTGVYETVHRSVKEKKTE